jgi:hypothetical protein
VDIIVRFLIFRLTGDRLFANRGLLGRGTVVFPVEEIGEKEADEDADLVLKLIWPDSRGKRSGRDTPTSRNHP